MALNKCVAALAPSLPYRNHATNLFLFFRFHFHLLLFVYAGTVRSTLLNQDVRQGGPHRTLVALRGPVWRGVVWRGVALAALCRKQSHFLPLIKELLPAAR